MLDELSATLEYLFNDGVEDENDARIEKLATDHAASYSHDAMALALNDYAELAEQSRDRLQMLGGFDFAVIDEARQIAHKLRLRSAQVPKPVSGVEEARDVRNRMAWLLMDRMNRVRAAARYVFRNRPAMVREVTSAYERRRRAEQRRAEQREREQEAPQTDIKEPAA